MLLVACLRLQSDETSVIQEETQGEEVAVISCEVYGEITRTIEPFPCLSLVIPQHRISLQVCHDVGGNVKLIVFCLCCC